MSEHQEEEQQQDGTVSILGLDRSVGSMHYVISIYFQGTKPCRNSHGSRGVGGGGRQDNHAEITLHTTAVAAFSLSQDLLMSTSSAKSLHP